MQESPPTQIGTKTGTVIVIQPGEQLNAATAIRLKQQLIEILSEQTCSALSIDMSQVEALDSAGLMLLVSTLTLAQRLGKRFSLLGISPSIRIIFELTQLDRVFEILESQPQSITQAAA